MCGRRPAHNFSPEWNSEYGADKKWHQPLDVDRMSQLAKRATLDDDGKSSDQRDTLRRCYDVEPNRRCDQSECETSKSGNKRAYEGRNEIDD